MSVGRLTPSREAITLADTLVGETELHRRVLLETIESAEGGTPSESGRTICPDSTDNVRSPIARFSRAVELQACPRGTTGLMHSHVSTPQLQNPEHSLPDISNVLYGGVDASIIVGVESHDLFVAPDDTDAGIAAFEDALGLEIDSTDDVVSAIKNGTITSPTDARNRLRSRMGPLFDTAPSGFTDLAARITELDSKGALPAHEPIEMASPVQPPRVEQKSADGTHSASQGTLISENCRKMRSGFQRNTETVETAASSLSEINWTQVVATSIVTSAVTTTTNRWLGLQ